MNEPGLRHCQGCDTDYLEDEVQLYEVKLDPMHLESLMFAEWCSDCVREAQLEAKSFGFTKITPAVRTTQ